LIALACGDICRTKISDRVHVWSEPALKEACLYEFAETDLQLQAVEFICKFPYIWKNYDVMVLPPAFPYGGMENPQLTFLNSCLITGDRSLMDVTVHEQTHSWFGNLVTNGNWSAFWLNEGFTMYVERLSIGRLHGEKFRHFHHFLGYGELIKACNSLPEPLTKLHPNLKGMDPDDAFSRIPYEKGCLFLLYLESKVGGRDNMIECLRQYVETFAYHSVTEDDFIGHFKKTFPDVGLEVDWNEWLYGSGLPKWNPSTYLDNEIMKLCEDLAGHWLKDVVAFNERTKEKDLSGWSATQIMVFLDLLQNSKKLLSAGLLKKLDATYDFSASKNVEIQIRWIQLNVCNNHINDLILTLADHFASNNGRGIYIKTLYQNLLDLAKKNPTILEMNWVTTLYAKNQNFYHSVVRRVLDPLFTSISVTSKK